MSWHVQYESRAAFLADQRTFESGTPAGDQLQEARAAAESIITSRCVADESKDVMVTLFGHANAQHEPAQGWANDCVTVTVTQKAVQPAAPSHGGSQ